MSSSTLKIPGVVGRSDNLLWIDPSQVTIIPGANPRDEDLAIDDLKPLIAAHGFRQDRPISVYREEDGTLTLIDGQRRLLCVRALIEEGQLIPRIPAILLPRMADPIDRLLSALAANRGKDLLPTEEARAFARLLNFGWDTEKIAREVGRSARYVQQRLILLEATAPVVDALKNGTITTTDAIVRLSAPVSGRARPRPSRWRSAPRRRRRSRPRPVRAPVKSASWGPCGSWKTTMARPWSCRSRSSSLGCRKELPMTVWLIHFRQEARA